MTKEWYKSKTIWGALVAVGSSVAIAFGVDIGAESQAEIVDVIMAIVGAIGGGFAIYGRVVSK